MWPVWAVALGIFVVAWILQFVGHKLEGKKPAFFEDIQFLLIGPIWLMGFIYRRLGYTLLRPSRPVLPGSDLRAEEELANLVGDD